MDERRKFERVKLPPSALIHVLDEEGKRIGRVVMLGPGGLLIETDARFVEGSPQRVVLVDKSERIHRSLVVVEKYRTEEGIAMEFRALEVEAGIDIGILIGKYSITGPAAHERAG